MDTSFVGLLIGLAFVVAIFWVGTKNGVFYGYTPTISMDPPEPPRADPDVVARLEEQNRILKDLLQEQQKVNAELIAKVRKND